MELFLRFSFEKIGEIQCPKKPSQLFFDRIFCGFFLWKVMIGDLRILFRRFRSLCTRWYPAYQRRSLGKSFSRPEVATLARIVLRSQDIVFKTVIQMDIRQVGTMLETYYFVCLLYPIILLTRTQKIVYHIIMTRSCIFSQLCTVTKNEYGPPTK